MTFALFVLVIIIAAGVIVLGAAALREAGRC